MPGSAVEIRVATRPTLNAICLKSAVLCVECDVVSDSPHDHCLVCGSRSLFNIARLLGGSLPKERAKLVEATVPAASVPVRVLPFPRSHKAARGRRPRVRLNHH
jgi:hypothetical protein